MHEDSWAILHRWADVILFGHRKTPQLATSRKAKAKLTGIDQSRMFMMERTGAWDAKNLCGLPTEIRCGSSAKGACDIFDQEMCGARSWQTTE